MRQRTREEWEALREFCSERYDKAAREVERTHYVHNGWHLSQRAAKDRLFFWYEMHGDCEMICRRMATTTQEVSDGD